MKKRKNKLFFVLTEKNKESSYKRNHLIACSDKKDLVEKYKLQLVANNYNDSFEIEEREHIGWSSFLRYQDYELEEYQGLLYPNKNIKFAEDKSTKLVKNLKSTKSNLEKLKDELSEESILSVNDTIKILERKIVLESNKKLNIPMM